MNTVTKLAPLAKRTYRKYCKTITEAELRKRVEGGEAQVQIAKALDRTPTQISHACAVLGIKRKRGESRESLLRQRIRELEAKLATVEAQQ